MATTTVQQGVVVPSIMNSDLYVAVTTGLNDRVINLGKTGMKDHVTSEGNHTILHLAALCNKDITVEAILKNFPELLRVTNSRKETALHLAAKEGYFRVVKKLIDKSKTYNPTEEFIRKVNEDDDTALHLAAQKNQRTVVEEIVKADPTDKHYPNKKSETPLYLAAIGGHKDVLELILKNCKDAAVEGPDDKTALHAAAISGDAGCVEVILQVKGSDLVNKVDTIGWTAMHYAASRNCVSVPKIIEAEQATPHNSQNLPQRDSHMDNPMKKTPLHIAASEGHVSMVHELMEVYNYTSTIIGAVDADGRNILHIAADREHKEVVQCILKEYPEAEKLLNEGDKNGNTPLHLLVMRGCFVQELINFKGVHINAENNDKWTPYDLLYLEERIVIDQLKIKEELDKVQDGQQWKFFSIQRRSKVNKRESLVPLSKSSRKDVKFMKDKKRQMKEKVQVYRDRATTQIVVTALITAVTFTVGFTMPGGSDKGYAVLPKKTYFRICMIADAVALFFSTCSLFLYFVSSLYQDPDPVKTLSTLCVVLNIVSVIAMMVTFITGTYVVLPHSKPLGFSVLAFSVVFILFVSFVSLKFIVERPVTKKIKV